MGKGQVTNKAGEAVTNEEVDERKEVNFDQKDAEVSKDHKKEAKSDPMEVDEVGNRASKKGVGEKGKNKKEPEQTKKNHEPKTPVGPTIVRPVRERKSVERLVSIIENDAAKEFHVEKGRGAALKDIPNVAYKLSKKNVPEETLKLLHSVLFVRRGKASEIKSNILRFSGFVWHENEAKQKAKVQEKLENINKTMLLEFCDILDIPVVKTTAKKVDVIAQLIDFLMVPHATTNELHVKSESKEHVSEPESGKEDAKKRKRDSNNSPKTESASKTDSKKEATVSSAKGTKSKDQSGSPPPTRTFQRKRNNPVSDKKTSTTRKSESKGKTEVKEAEKEEAPKQEKLKPSDAELKTAVCDILKEVDFETTTFNYIVRLLDERFRTDLTPRRASIKAMVHQELARIADEETDSDAEDAGKEAIGHKA